MSKAETQEITDDLTDFLRGYYKQDIMQLATHYPREQKALHIDYQDLYQYDQLLATDLINQPETVKQALNTALNLVDIPVAIDFSQANVRVLNLPDTYDVPHVSRVNQTNKLLAFKGQVSKLSAVKPKIDDAAFECQRCGIIVNIPQRSNEFQEPHECRGCERQGPFRVNVDQSTFINHQSVRVQQPPEKTKGGTAQELDLVVEEDVVDSCEAGDRVTVTGVTQLQQTSENGEKSPIFEPYLEAEHIEQEETTFEDVEVEPYLDEIHAIASGERGDPYELLVRSMNPSHYGDETIKAALALQLFGGWEKDKPDGSHKRGDIHILLLGDPGCGKTTHLSYVNNIALRSMKASGKGATEAGMTASAVQDDFGGNQWSLEAGALVLADRGIACIDEIDKMPEQVRSSFHEALEEQELHINKAGINTTLPTRTSILSAGNPKHGRFSDYEPIPEQIELGPAMMSRFDLMFMVSDDPEEEKDKNVVGHILDSDDAAAAYTQGETLDEDQEAKIQPAIDVEVLRAYIAHAKQTCHPRFKNEDVKSYLAESFYSFRAAAYDEDDEMPIPVTYRKVEALKRLAEASARVRLSDEITLTDVDRAVELVETSMRQVGYDPETEQFDADLVETGSSKSMRDRRRQVKSVVRELEEEMDDGPARRHIIKESTALGYDSGMVDHDIDKMLENGELYRSAKDDDVIRVS